jgi:hypothetical protein
LVNASGKDLSGFGAKRQPSFTTTRRGRLARRAERRRSVLVNARGKDLSGFGAKRQILKELAPQVGLESTCKRTFNNLQGRGWHPRTPKALIIGQTELQNRSQERAERLQQPGQCGIMHLYRDDFHHTVDNHLSDKREAKEKPKPPMQPSVIRQPQVPRNVPALLSMVTVIAAEGVLLGPVETS